MCASCGEGNSCGVIILTHPNSPYSLSNIKNDTHGRLISGETMIENRKLILCNVYCPNRDDPEFMLESVVKTIDEYMQTGADGVILRGDFNLVMDTSMDRRNSERNNVNALQVLKELMDRTSLCDIWRALHPQTRRYTWHRGDRSSNRLQASRIDMFMVSQWMVDIVQSCEIEPGFMTDHSIVILEVGVDEFRRGAGIWKFNNKLLANDNFCVKAQELIEHVIKNTVMLNPNDRWETIKMELSWFCKCYAQSKARNKKNEMKKMLRKKARLELKLSDNFNSTIGMEIKNLNNKIDEFALERATSCIFRSKCRYMKDGEKMFRVLHVHRKTKIFGKEYEMCNY